MSSPTIGKFLSAKRLSPDRIARDEDGDVIDEREIGFERAAGIKARRLLGSDRQIIDHDFRARTAQFLDDLFAGRFLFQWKKGAIRFIIFHVRGVAIEYATHHDDSASRFDLLAKDLGAVRRGENCFGGIEAYFPAIDVESSDDFDIIRLIRADFPVHQSDIGTIAGRVSIKVDALKE